jgi:nickel/cobalt transporter (NiCoT) family protein
MNVATIAQLFNDSADRVLSKVLGIYGFLIAANIAAWIWALTAFHDRPTLLGLAFLAYSFGLRHAFDADHIAAIDNVTRKLMQEGKRPIGVGLFFSLGHSTIVVLLAVAIVLTTIALQAHFEALENIVGVIGTSASTLFLFAIAAANFLVLTQVYRAFKRARSGERLSEVDINDILAKRGVFGRLLYPTFALIERSWHMYPLGFLFGLGFDTATEVGLLGISATQAAQGMSIWSILIFATLFTAGMSLTDTTDSTLMVGAYGWAFVKPIRKLYYNMTITFISVAAAVIVGSIEALGLIGDKLGLQGPLWKGVATLSDNFGLVGYGIVAFFIASWIVSYTVYRINGYDCIEDVTL